MVTTNKRVLELIQILNINVQHLLKIPVDELMVNEDFVLLFGLPRFLVSEVPLAFHAAS